MGNGSVRADCGRARGRAFQEERRACVTVGSRQAVLGVTSKGSSLVDMVAASEPGRVPGEGGDHSPVGSGSHGRGFPEGNDLVRFVKACSGATLAVWTGFGGERRCESPELGSERRTRFKQY